MQFLAPVLYSRHSRARTAAYAHVDWPPLRELITLAVRSSGCELSRL